MIRFVLATTATVVGMSIAGAAPVYLSCEIPLDRGQKAEFSFTVDEQAGTVSRVVKASGYTETTRAAFTPDKIIINGSGASWMIDRINLSFQRTIKLINATDQGTCEIETAPKRAF